MKVLSVRQPWLYLILGGRKDVEVRTWRTTHRGDILLHASRSVDVEACERFGLLPERMVIGAIMGRCRLVDVVEYNRLSFIEDFERHLNPLEGYQTGRFGWVLDNVKRVPLKFTRGQLGLWEYKERPVSYPGMLV